ncbi:bifunctional protein-serine/threonine kinase/phosphatase, partial [bacterium]
MRANDGPTCRIVVRKRSTERGVRFLSRDQLAVRAGYCSRAGRRAENQDFAGFGDPERLARDPRGLAFAIADGVSFGKGGRVAAELAVRAFLDGWYAADPTAGVAATGARLLGSVNAWLHDVARRDDSLRHASTTFTALVLRGRSAHWLHAGDTRAWLLHDGELTCLTDDHVLDAPDLRHVLKRAVGMETSLRLDHGVQPLREHDRLMLCSDGIHGVLGDRRLRELLLRRGDPDEDAEAIVAAALDSGSQDNATCLVIDVLGLPESAAPELLTHFAALPIAPPPKPGERLDGFHVIAPLAEGRYSVLMRAIDEARGTEVVLKFPRPRVASAAIFHLAFVREAWVATHLRSPWIAEVLPLAEGRQTQLYCAMPFYRGETLEARLTREPPLSLAEGSAIAARLVRALASLHRAGVIHRDIKPENV